MRSGSQNHHRFYAASMQFFGDLDPFSQGFIINSDKKSETVNLYRKTEILEISDINCVAFFCALFHSKTNSDVPKYFMPKLNLTMGELPWPAIKAMPVFCMSHRIFYL